MNLPTTPPPPPQYSGALTEAKKELAIAVAELGEAQNRALELEQRIVDLRQTVSVLSKLCGEEDMDVEDSLGLTDAIRSVFLSVGQSRGLTAHDVRLHLEGQGFNTRRYGNLLASIHTVIKRLETKHEIKSTGTMGDKPAYAVTQQGMIVAGFKGIGKVLSALKAAKSEGASTAPPPPPGLQMPPAYVSGMRGNEKPKDRK